MIERDWITEAGLRAVCYLIPGRHRCGYVMVSPGHPLHGVDYNQPCAALREWPAVTATHGGKGATADEGVCRAPEDVFDVHGGITYSGGNPHKPAPSDGGWWFGFDCMHGGDGSLNPLRQAYSSGPVRSQEYVVAECESLARQIVDFFVSGRDISSGVGERGCLSQVKDIQVTNTLLCKLGSIAVHADELLSADGHEFDREAILAILSDVEVQAWIKAMGPLLPKKRHGG